MKKQLLVLLASVLGSGVVSAQIPNAGFENWTAMTGYNNPDEWGNPNDFTTALMVYTCTKGTPGNPGASYIKLTSKAVIGGVVPGVAVTGTIVVTPLSFTGGFPISTQPAALNGSWQYMASGADQGYISVLFTKFNTGTNQRDTIGYTKHDLVGMEMAWANFSIPLSYSSGTMPDTCMIALSSSGTTPVANSYLYVDNLSFGAVNQVAEISSDKQFSISPNPSIENFTVSMDENNAVINSYEIYDMSGRLIRNEQVNKAGQQIIDVHALNSGEYLIRIYSGEKIMTRKFIRK